MRIFAFAFAFGWCEQSLMQNIALINMMSEFTILP